MTENERLIYGSYGEQRYLHSDEIFCKERNWNINLPSEREFKNGYCIITDKDNTAYSIDELVELLNEFQKENQQLKNNMKIKLCNNCIYWRMGTAGLNDNYCSLTDEWADWEGTCEKWKGYHD